LYTYITIKHQSQVLKNRFERNAGINCSWFILGFTMLLMLQECTSTFPGKLSLLERRTSMTGESHLNNPG
jgi:hypothetical protein